NSLSHADQAKVTAACGKRRSSVEATPIVSNTEPYCVAIEGQFHDHLVGPRVSQGVCNSLLPYPEQVTFNTIGKSPRLPLHLDFSLNRTPGSRLLYNLRKGAGQTTLLQCFRTQIPNRTACFGQ